MHIKICKGITLKLDLVYIRGHGKTPLIIVDLMNNLSKIIIRITS